MRHRPLYDKTTNLVAATYFNYLLRIEITEHSEEHVGLVVLIVVGGEGFVKQMGIAVGFSAKGIDFGEGIIVGFPVA
jgi:hypothetical protein